LFCYTSQDKCLIPLFLYINWIVSLDRR